MSRYSAFAIAKNALSYHQGWERAWAKPEMKKEYDAVIVGAADGTRTPTQTRLTY